ncbi:MlaC/ttg2D family ABC transporter substrate-binding protein [Anianabacter salinae]|uniref:MlaC/ttg2D family ABC transporter substrate-binding protein n=1 Tax=Anianabacter salinae TaxID=2851023 RepID=UPI00225E6892|nr:ABC transporter substrate-binding protein [Anianabacter salinae]MBV0913292.1 ABC transporter substrate-binding protein [Anianabacter salinae]
MRNSPLTRRLFLATSSAAAVMVARPALAMSEAEATQLVQQAIAELQAIIDSGQSERQMLGRFKAYFERFADVPVIAQFALGRGVNASAAERRAFEDAFAGYISRKYGRRFREFIGAQIDIAGAAQLRENQYEVRSTVRLRGQAPFELAFRVSDQSGRGRMFDLIIEGVSLLRVEGQEVRDLLIRYGDDVGRVAQHLNQAG